MFDYLIDFFTGPGAWFCVAPKYNIMGQEYKFDFCSAFALPIQLQIQAVTSWVLYIITGIACFQMILKAIFGTAPLFGLAGDEAQREQADLRALHDRDFNRHLETEYDRAKSR